MTTDRNMGKTQMWGKIRSSVNRQYSSRAPYNEMNSQSNQLEKRSQFLDD